jgi:hypothetical protein
VDELDHIRFEVLQNRGNRCFLQPKPNALHYIFNAEYLAQN